MRERVVGSRADSAVVLELVMMAVVVEVVEGNDGVVGEVPRWDIAVVEEDGWTIMFWRRVQGTKCCASMDRKQIWK